MMTIDIGQWLKAVRSKIETPAQDCTSVRAGRRRRTGLIAVFVGAMICSSLAMTIAWSTADAQGLEAGAGLRKARERNRRTDARQRKATESIARAADKAARLNTRTNTRTNDVATRGRAAKAGRQRP
jgi:hypothetical protein